MFVKIDADRKISVGEADDFKRFALHVPAHGEVRDFFVDGIDDDGPDHVWIAIATVTAHCGRADDEDWKTSFARMMEGARRFGWVSEDGTRIRSHIVRVD